MFSLTSYSFFEKVLNAGGEIYLVGGCVRDQLLKRPIKDLDLIVRLISFPELVKILKTCGYVNLVGKSFGVIKFRPREQNDTEFDIALPRCEVSTGIGHKDFDVHFDETMPIEKDLLRRDFTINAMAQNLSNGQIIDPSGGQQDLLKKEINTVFNQAFVEDPLRLLRAVQFSARLGFHISEKTFSQMKEHAKLIASVAPERIILEIKKLFSAPKPSLGFELMRQTGMLPFIFPELHQTIGVTQPKKRGEDVYTHSLKALDATQSAQEIESRGNLDIMFAALLHDVGKPKTHKVLEDGETVFFNHHIISSGIARRWLKDYKVTTIGVDIKKVCHLIKNHMFETRHFEENEKALRRFINKVGKENICDLMDLRLADKKAGKYPDKVYGILKLRDMIRTELNKKPPFTPKDLAVNGHDIMAMGYKPGPIIGKIQKCLMEKVLDDPALNTKESLTTIIKENFS